MSNEIALNVQIDKEAVEAQVVSAIMKSSIGLHLEQAINEALEKPEGYNKESWLAGAIKQRVAVTIQGFIENSLAANEELRAKVSAKVVELATDDCIAQLVRRAFARH